MSGITLLMGKCIAGSPPITIKRIEVFPLIYPMRGRFKFFEDPAGRMQGRAAALIRITAENGISGWGESVPIPRWTYETLESVTTTIRRYFAPVLLGRNIFDLVSIHESMDSAIAPSFNTGQPIARAGIDIALHDLIGKVKQCSIPELWGMQPARSLLLSWTLNPKRLKETDSLIDAGRELGFQNFNVKVAPDPDFDIGLCKRVKKRVPDGFLWADANGGYSVEAALKVAPKLAAAGVDVLEQPLKPNEISGYQALKHQGALPIYMDEGVVSPKTLFEFIKLNMLDGVAMKPARCGGLAPAKEQMEILQANGLGILGSGLTDPDISLAATLALFGAFHIDRPAALNGPQFIRESILQEPLTPSAGRLSVPRGYGLGVEVDEDKVRSMTVDLQ